MKVKGDFITNSSSTAYFFIFNGNTKEDLFKAIMKRPQRFEAEDDIGWDEPHIIKVDAEFIVDSINKVYGTVGGFYGDNIVKINPIEGLIKEFEKHANYWEKASKKDSWCKKYNTRSENQLKAIKEAKEKGLKNFLQINFGTSEGHVWGGNACILHGSTGFDVRRKDLYVVTDVRS